MYGDATNVQRRDTGWRNDLDLDSFIAKVLDHSAQGSGLAGSSGSSVEDVVARSRLPEYLFLLTAEIERAAAEVDVWISKRAMGTASAENGPRIIYERLAARTPVQDWFSMCCAFALQSMKSSCSFLLTWISCFRFHPGALIEAHCVLWLAFVGTVIHVLVGSLDDLHRIRRSDVKNLKSHVVEDFRLRDGRQVGFLEMESTHKTFAHTPDSTTSRGHVLGS